MTFWNTADGATDIAKDSVLVVGALTAVALGNIPAGGSGELAISEQWELPKGDAALEQGAAVYWDGSAMATTAVSGRAPCYVLEPAPAEAERVRVLLNGR